MGLGDVRFHGRHIRLGGADLRLQIGHVGDSILVRRLGLRERVLKRHRIDLRQHIAFFDLGVEVDANGDNVARNHGAYGYGIDGIDRTGSLHHLRDVAVLYLGGEVLCGGSSADRDVAQPDQQRNRRRNQQRSVHHRALPKTFEDFEQPRHFLRILSGTVGQMLSA